MAAPRPPPGLAVLIDELVEEFLLRLPPEDPALLARAALVSRQWYRVVTGPAFRRRFRQLHRSTPLLGYILVDSVRFVPMSSFRPPHTHRRGMRAVSANHGRVLLYRLSEEDPDAPCSAVKDLDVLLSVWHPITDEQHDLPVVPLRLAHYMSMPDWDAAVICAVGDGCDHLHCHFKVVFVGNRERRTFSCFYSSEAGSWSDPVFASGKLGNFFTPGNSVLIGTVLYTTCSARNEIFKYDLRTHQMCNISMTPGPGVQSGVIGCFSRLIAAEDGSLGFAQASNSTLGLWLRENGRLEESRAMDLHTLLPVNALPDLLRLPYDERILAEPWVVAFAETGAGVIFLYTYTGYFTIDLKSGSCKRVGDLGVLSSGRVVPYVSFCTPAPGAVSTDDTPGAGVVISTDEVPVAGIAVSTDEASRAGVVVVSADEGPGAAVTCQVPKKL